VIDFDSFIPDEIMSAPEHPLAQSLELPLPNANSASSEEICQIHQSQRFPLLLSESLRWIPKHPGNIGGVYRVASS
jgi:hypothetical protein